MKLHIYGFCSATGHEEHLEVMELTPMLLYTQDLHGVNAGRLVTLRGRRCVNLDGMGKDRASKVYIVLVAMMHDSTSRQPKVSGTHYMRQLLSCQYDVLPNNVKQGDIRGIKSQNITYKSRRSLRKEGV